MKLSVIVPCFNAADTIGVQLEALAKQEWSEPWEVIVVDNGSTDSSLAIAEQFKERVPNLRIVNASDQPGAAHARNTGAKVAQGEFLAFCDADDEVAESWVAAMGQALAEHDFVAGRHEFDKLNEPWLLKSRTLLQQKGLQDYKYPPFLPHAASSNLGIKRAIHEAVGGYDETMLRLQDTDYCWRVQLAGTELKFVDTVVIQYRLRDSLAKRFQQARLWGVYNVLLYKKYRPLGMPALPWQSGLLEWVRLLKRSRQLYQKGSRVRWLGDLARCIGRIEGSIKYRVWAL